MPGDLNIRLDSTLDRLLAIAFTACQALFSLLIRTVPVRGTGIDLGKGVDDSMRRVIWLA